MAAEAFASSIAISSQSVQDEIRAAPAVVLPHSESRQPQPDTSFGAEEPAPPEIYSGTVNHDANLDSTTSDQALKFHPSDQNTSGGENDDTIKVKRARGTRGRGDYRNARMYRERMRAQMENHAHVSSLQSSRDGNRGEDIALRGRGNSTFNELSKPGPDSRSYVQRAIEYSGSTPPPRAPSFMRRTPQQQDMITIHGPPSSTNRRGNVFRRPRPQGLSAPLQNFGGPQHRRPEDDWTQWIELGVRLTSLPSTVTTLDLWKTFSKEGSIATIEIFEDSKGEKDGRGRLRFRYISALVSLLLRCTC